MRKSGFQIVPASITASLLFASLAGCVHEESPMSVGVLIQDAKTLSAHDPAGLGTDQVVLERVTLEDHDEGLEIALYQPVNAHSPLPAVVFLPGLFATDDQYQSYAQALASRGFVVAVRDWYSFLRSDHELARDASVIADWLMNTGKAAEGRIGVAGHSTGGKDAILAALEDRRFAAVVAIDPDDYGTPSVARGPVSHLQVPLLLIGAEVAWQGPDICAPKETNYQRFFERAPPGTIELTLRDADHVQMLDDPDRFGYDICRYGTADSRLVRITARRATVRFFVQHLQGGAAMPAPPAAQGFLRVAGHPSRKPKSKETLIHRQGAVFKTPSPAPE